MRISYGLVSGVGKCLVVTLSFWISSAYSMTPEVMNQSGYNREFKLLDADGNNKLSAKETSKDSVFGDNGFTKADRNRNHALDKEEFATYKSKVQQKQAKQAASDSAITAKIKSNYLIEKNFRSFKVSVETKGGVVVLSGFVENESSRKRAEQIAYEISGVKAVKNALVVKP
jgi:hyperosmotically inducible periplasmic protein